MEPFPVDLCTWHMQGLSRSNVDVHMCYICRETSNRCVCKQCHSNRLCMTRLSNVCLMQTLMKLIIAISYPARISLLGVTEESGVHGGSFFTSKASTYVCPSHTKPQRVGSNITKEGFRAPLMLERTLQLTVLQQWCQEGEAHGLHVYRGIHWMIRP